MERRMSLLLLLHLLLYLRTKVVDTPAFSLLLALFPFFVSFACTVTALSITAATILQRRISCSCSFFFARAGWQERSDGGSIRRRSEEEIESNICPKKEERRRRKTHAHLAPTHSYTSELNFSSTPRSPLPE